MHKSEPPGCQSSLGGRAGLALHTSMQSNENLMRSWALHAFYVKLVTLPLQVCNNKIVNYTLFSIILKFGLFVCLFVCLFELRLYSYKQTNKPNFKIIESNV